MERNGLRGACAERDQSEKRVRAASRCKQGSLLELQTPRRAAKGVMTTQPIDITTSTGR